MKVVQLGLVAAGGQVTIDFDALRYLEGRRTPLEAMEIWRLPEWQWCDRVAAAPSLLVDVPEHLQVDIRSVTASELERLSRNQLADIASSWGLPYSGPKPKIVAQLLATAALLRRLEGETEETLATLTVRELDEMLTTSRQGRYGIKATKVRLLIGWRDAMHEQHLRRLAQSVHSAEVRKARARGETIPEYTSRVDEILPTIRARRVPPEELDRRVKALIVGIETRPGDVVRIVGSGFGASDPGLTYVVEGETPQGLPLLRCRERSRWPLIAVHRCHLQSVPA